MWAVRFRAWDKDNDRMVFSDNGNYCFVVNCEGGVDVYEINGTEKTLLNTEKPQQCVLLQDRCKQAMYEDDFLSIQDGDKKAIAVVKFQQGTFGILVLKKGTYLSRSEYYSFSALDQYVDIEKESEIIGNKHENPDWYNLSWFSLG